MFDVEADRADHSVAISHHLKGNLSIMTDREADHRESVFQLCVTSSISTSRRACGTATLMTAMSVMMSSGCILRLTRVLGKEGWRWILSDGDTPDLFRMILMTEQS